MRPHPSLSQQIVPAPKTSIPLAIDIQWNRRKCEGQSQTSPDIKHFAWSSCSCPVIHEVRIAEEQEVLEHHVRDEHLAAEVAVRIDDVAVGGREDEDHTYSILLAF